MPDVSYSAPEKHIKDPEDVVKFQKSIAFERLCSALASFSNAAVDRVTSDKSITISKNVASFLTFISALNSILEEVQPDEGPRRFGNVAFRTWLQMFEQAVDATIPNIFPSLQRDAMLELRTYFFGSFGSGERLDYGTGHELSFLAVVKGLYIAEVFSAPQDDVAIVLKVFPEYFDLVRRLVRKYNLEPAGSHGVWGLDDYCFLPYIFGSAQLRNVQSYPTPSMTSDKAQVDRLKADNLYFAAVGFIFEVKKGPFFEHSPTLSDISAVRSWIKVNQGLGKMYRGEVLTKFPVVQHFYFGTALFPFEESPNKEELTADLGVAPKRTNRIDRTMAPPSRTLA